MKLGFVFPGQGSQTPGMGQDLVRKYAVARDLYQEASDVLGYDLLTACENQNGELEDTRVVQPAILVHSIASWSVVQELAESKPEIVTGHSLGELSAVVAAGGLSFGKAVELVKLRAELMANAEQNGGMAVVFGLPEEPLRRVCAELSRPGHVVGIANRNSAEQWVISGHRHALQAAADRLSQEGGVVKHLAVSIPAHSELMAPALAPFEAAIRAADPKDCNVRVISCNSGELYGQAGELAPMLSKQLTECVNWPLTMNAMLEQGIDTVVELGPKTVLRDLIRLEFPKLRALSFGTADEAGAMQRLLNPALQEALEASALAKAQAEQFLQACLRIAVGTPALKEQSPVGFENQIRAPYRAILTELDGLRADADAPVDLSVLRKAAESSLRILRAKGLAADASRTLLEQAAAGCDVTEAIAEYLL